MKAINIKKYKDISMKENCLKSIKQLYLSAFPKFERLDFQTIKNFELKNSELYAFFDNSEFIGFSYLINYKNVVYIVYLAVKEECRSNGYGSKIISSISKIYKNKPLILCAEAPKKMGDIKSKRINFYRKNDFYVSDLQTECLGSKFNILYKGKRPKDITIKRTIISIFPLCDNFKKIKIKVHKVNSKNLNKAIKIQKAIFPLENGGKDLFDSVQGKPLHFLEKAEYFIVDADDKTVGICGIYSYKDYKNDAWLGWYGIVEEERQKGYGTKAFNYILTRAKERGFEHLRLYTDEIDNAKAIKLYEKMGMTKETYQNEKDSHYEVGQTLIFSKNLIGKKVALWNNKNLYLGLHDEHNGIM